MYTIDYTLSHGWNAHVFIQDECHVVVMTVSHPFFHGHPLCCVVLRCDETTGGSLHSQIEHHGRDKFATPILYGIDNSKFYDIFPTYT